MQVFMITIDRESYPVLVFPGRPPALLDKTLAKLYQVETRYINRAVERNPERFPSDFCFQLTLEEARMCDEIGDEELVWKRGHLPKAFTHLGGNMLATLLDSVIAIRRSVQIVRAVTALESKGNAAEASLSHGRVVSALAAEVYRQLSRIEVLENELRQVKQRLNDYEVRRLLLPNPDLASGPVISANQARQLKEMVDQQASTREGKMKLWRAFQRYFDVTRYIHLPGNRFAEAVSWMRSRDSQR